MRGEFVPLWLNINIVSRYFKYVHIVQITHQTCRYIAHKLCCFFFPTVPTVEVKALACNDKWCIAVFLLVISGPSLRFRIPCCLGHPPALLRFAPFSRNSLWDVLISLSKSTSFSVYWPSLNEHWIGSSAIVTNKQYLYTYIFIFYILLYIYVYMFYYIHTCIYIYIYIPGFYWPPRFFQMFTFTNLTPRYVRAHLVGHCEGRCQHRTFDSSRSFDRRESRVLWGSSPFFGWLEKDVWKLRFLWSWRDSMEVLPKKIADFAEIYSLICFVLFGVIWTFSSGIFLVIADGHHHLHFFTNM